MKDGVSPGNVKEQKIGGTDCLKKFINIDPVIGITKIASRKSKTCYKETGLITSREKQKSLVGKHNCET
jgi:hypothetical protein